MFLEDLMIPASKLRNYKQILPTYPSSIEKRFLSTVRDTSTDDHELMCKIWVLPIISNPLPWCVGFWGTSASNPVYAQLHTRSSVQYFSHCGSARITCTINARFFINKPERKQRLRPSILKYGHTERHCNVLLRENITLVRSFVSIHA